MLYLHIQSLASNIMHSYRVNAWKRKYIENSLVACIWCGMSVGL